MLFKEGVLKKFEKFAGKHLWQRLFFNKVASLRPATLVKRRLAQVFLCEFCEIFKSTSDGCFFVTQYNCYIGLIWGVWFMLCGRLGKNPRIIRFNKNKIFVRQCSSFVNRFTCLSHWQKRTEVFLNSTFFQNFWRIFRKVFVVETVNRKGASQ